MIKRVILKNFKKIEDQTYEFGQFDLIVGVNNSGKSTVLQALAIWQFLVDQFRNTPRPSSKSKRNGILVILPNFTALPLPEFSLLWRNKTDRASVDQGNGKKKQEFIIIKIEVVWEGVDQKEYSFEVNLRYQNPQTVYAIPAKGWDYFKNISNNPDFPRIAYVPPFSGLEPVELRLDDGPLRQQVGKGQPGGILRNLLLNVVKSDEVKQTNDWQELSNYVKKWFNVNLNRPLYKSGQDVNIIVEYKSFKKNYDIIAGGSGFHQILTVMAFLYGYKPTTILLDEPDAHLHVRLQGDLVKELSKIGRERGTQIIVATHAEEFMKQVDPSQILSILDGAPKRIENRANVMHAMAIIANDELVQIQDSPFVLYVEGDTDERIIKAWSQVLDMGNILKKYKIHALKGGSKDSMRKRADEHFKAIKQMVPDVKRHIIFDFDDKPLNIEKGTQNITEWQRKNIENYLLVPDAWIRSVDRHFRGAQIFSLNCSKIINDFFESENLILPPRSDWKSLKANIFKSVDGKKILFEDENSLFQQLRKSYDHLILPREEIANSMITEEIHDDIKLFFEKLKKIAENTDVIND